MFKDLEKNIFGFFFMLLWVVVLIVLVTHPRADAAIGGTVFGGVNNLIGTLLKGNAPESA